MCRNSVQFVIDIHGAAKNSFNLAPICIVALNFVTFFSAPDYSAARVGAGGAPAGGPRLHFFVEGWRAYAGSVAKAKKRTGAAKFALYPTHYPPKTPSYDHKGPLCLAAR